VALKIGDKCPQCKEGLLERTDIGIACTECSFDLEIEEFVQANKKKEVSAGEYHYRPARVSIRIATPEEGEEFLRGLVVARSNNSNHLFVDLIDSVNELLQPYRAAKLAEEMLARDA
jgi:hypothetical protein